MKSAEDTTRREFFSFVLARLGYGTAPDEVERMVSIGFKAWIEEQLNPVDVLDRACSARLQRLRLKVKYNAGPGTPGPNNVPQTWPACDEERPLTLLDAPIDASWPLNDHSQPMDDAERRRPCAEVTAATILRAVHSHWQLRETLVSFWHDHFNIDAVGDRSIGVALPTYDRDVVRANCFGNFRTMLEAVATSTAMLTYLSNRSSKAGAANENYARELFELHTLGRAAYLNDRFDRWREVPGALAGQPEGYIDQDVYEAARAFTGWTVEDGQLSDGHTPLPRTGRFRYIENWHDGYQKRVLATEFEPFAPAMADGQKVLDLVAHHPATAKFVCTKLCRRLIADVPPNSIVEQATACWKKAENEPDQIAQVVRTIAMSSEFAASRGLKVRRPLSLAAALARASALDLVPTEGLANAIANAGQRLFGWPTPTGLADSSESLINVNAMRQRWNLVFGLANNIWGNGLIDSQMFASCEVASPREFVAAWLVQLAVPSNSATVDAIVGSSEIWPDEPMGDPNVPAVRKRATQLVALCAMSPYFQVS